jgi:hypothetical protein
MSSNRKVNTKQPDREGIIPLAEQRPCSCPHQTPDPGTVCEWPDLTAILQSFLTESFLPALVNAVSTVTPRQRGLKRSCEFRS